MQYFLFSLTYKFLDLCLNSFFYLFDTLVAMNLYVNVSTFRFSLWKYFTKIKCVGGTRSDNFEIKGNMPEVILNGSYMVTFVEDFKKQLDLSVKYPVYRRYTGIAYRNLDYPIRKQV
ncbi:unnamed protein product [Vicia faba]|uniref:Uncharacterized protein n=1 Tax=Vicia faba TaxID=3906 RepID=A0AAV1A6J5_VICFA|nr:unnamed protein product [Vicia faba]